MFHSFTHLSIKQFTKHSIHGLKIYCNTKYSILSIAVTRYNNCFKDAYLIDCSYIEGNPNQAVYYFDIDYFENSSTILREYKYNTINIANLCLVGTRPTI